MKKLISILFLFISIHVFAQNDSTKYIRYRYQYGSWLSRLRIDSVADIPNDTLYSKNGIARKGASIYVGDGTHWIKNIADSSMFATVYQNSLKANDTGVVHKALPETITGAKTFTSPLNSLNVTTIIKSGNNPLLQAYYQQGFTSTGYLAGMNENLLGIYPIGYGNTWNGHLAGYTNINADALTGTGTFSLKDFTGFKYYDTSVNKSYGADMTFTGYNSGAGIISGGSSVGAGNEAAFNVKNLKNSTLIGASSYSHTSNFNDSSQNLSLLGVSAFLNGRVDSSIALGSWVGNESTILNGGGLIIAGDNSGTPPGTSALHNTTIIGHHTFASKDNIAAIGSLGQNVVIGNPATVTDNAGNTRALYNNNTGDKLQVNGTGYFTGLVKQGTDTLANKSYVRSQTSLATGKVDTTNQTGMLKGVGNHIVPAISGTDYLTPAGNGSALTGITESQIANLTTDLASKANDASVVHLAGAETITGAKTFNNDVIVKKPTGMLDYASLLFGLTVGGSGVAFVPSDLSTHNGYFRFSFPDTNSVKFNTDYDGHIVNGYQRDILFGSNVANNLTIYQKDGSGNIGVKANLIVGAAADAVGDFVTRNAATGIITRRTASEAKADLAITYPDIPAGVIANGTTATTQALNDNTTNLATTAFVSNQIVNKWDLSGNTGAVRGTNFIGTKDAHALSFRTNNIEAAYFDSSDQHLHLNSGIISMNGFRIANSGYTGSLTSSFSGMGNMVLTPTNNQLILNTSLGVGGNGNNTSDVKFQVVTTTQGSIPAPAMTTANINAIIPSASSKGLQVYDSIKNSVYINTGTPGAPKWQRGVGTPDTTSLMSFGYGAGFASDTASSSTTAIYGGVYNSGTDTLDITSMQIGLKGTSPSVVVTIYYNDSLGVTAGATKLVNAGNTATDVYTGTSVTSFDNPKIPPGNWVWCQTTTVTTKPTFLAATLIGYKIHL